MPRMCVGIKHPLTLKLKLSLTLSLSFSFSLSSWRVFVCVSMCKNAKRRDGMEKNACLYVWERERKRERERDEGRMRERYFDVCENSASLRNDFLPKTSSSDLIDPKKIPPINRNFWAEKKFGDIVIAEKISDQNELSENRNSGNILLMKHTLIGDVTVVKIAVFLWSDKP